ncbi:hypothetical protein AQPE_0772 [Aquipluma nitroreducens]|uniref:Phospholipase n=1 Tax=Aquipluma nitroreducens TaxID=2010828 RepID=A0A5K7S517_9BACT|nr:hypothetical protein [Aquipluma nitroreducens]BBE16632.1 hypothetical protein AQPE_0772 [Aquipluma nitroreducens]
MLYLIIVLVVLIVLFAVFKLKKAQPEDTIEPETQEEPREVASDCCGAHEICEFDESAFNEEIIVYFNDEELDELRNIREADLTASQIDDLREVLYTMKTNEISKWIVSLGRRHIHLPEILKQEARQLMMNQ